MRQSIIIAYNGENLALKSEIPSVSGYINSVDSASWDTITSNNWVVTSFSLNKSGSSISVSGNHIKKNLSDQRLKEYLGKQFQTYLDVYKDYDYESTKKFFQKMVSDKRKAFLNGFLLEVAKKVQELALTDEETDNINAYLKKNYPQLRTYHIQPNH